MDSGQLNPSFLIAFPNPLTNQTTIEISDLQGEIVNLSIFDIDGNLIERPLENFIIPRDLFSIPWIPSVSMSSGKYFLSLETEVVSRTIDLMILK